MIWINKIKNFILFLFGKKKMSILNEDDLKNVTKAYIIKHNNDYIGIFVCINGSWSFMPYSIELANQLEKQLGQDLKICDLEFYNKFENLIEEFNNKKRLEKITNNIKRKDNEVSANNTLNTQQNRIG